MHGHHGHRTGQQITRRQIKLITYWLFKTYTIGIFIFIYGATSIYRIFMMIIIWLLHSSALMAFLRETGSHITRWQVTSQGNDAAAVFIHRLVMAFLLNLDENKSIKTETVSVSSKQTIKRTRQLKYLYALMELRYAFDSLGLFHVDKYAPGSHRAVHRVPFYWHGQTLIPTWISNTL